MIFPVHSGDIVYPDVLRTLYFTSTGIGTMPKPFRIHLLHHAHHARARFGPSLRQFCEMRYFGRREERGAGIFTRRPTSAAANTGCRIKRRLGDGVDERRSKWIFSFDGRSLADPAADGWQVKRDGGVFDQFTGATITPRAVVKAVHRALQYFASHREELFEPG